MSPEGKLLCAILKQTILDYMKLDPDSDCSLADYFMSEGEDYKTAEDIIFNGVPIYFGDLVFTFDQLVEMFPEAIKVSPSMAKKIISKKSIEY